jgi:glucose/arabinose dehydrogenase
MTNNIVQQRFIALFALAWLVVVGCIRFPPPTADSEYELNVDMIVAEGFRQPVGITHAGDGSGRLFVIEQDGLIKIIEDGEVLPEPFLDIQGNVSTGSEQGLLGLAFHPDYESNGFFFIHYTDRQGDTQIVRYSVSSNPNAADPASVVMLFSVDQPYGNHNGGQLAFGPDGYLYIGLGDGGSANDPQSNAQNLATPLGAILRIEVLDDGSYAIPDSNPFVDEQGADGRIWAWGLRNPWRFSFDSDTGDLYIGDVGQNRWEEINFQISDSGGGLNYGWRCMEGAHLNIEEPPCTTAAGDLTAPIVEYSHSDGISVNGGYVYRGSRYPQLDGAYFYGDYGSGRVWSIRLKDRVTQTWSQPRFELDSGVNISSFGQDEAGEIYLVDYSGGTIRRIRAVPVFN